MITATAMPREAISIHAPREGCDIVLVVFSGVFQYFNPRTP